MPKKTSDPKLIAMLDELARTATEADRWFVRLKRAFNRLDKARRKVARLHRRIDKHNQAKEA